MEKISLEYLNEVSLGDKKMIDEMIIIFLEQVPEFIEDFNKYLKQKDYKNIAKVAHKAKSSTSIVGLDELSMKLKEMEEKAELSEDEKCFKETIDLFINTCEKAVKDLNTILNKNL